MDEISEVLNVSVLIVEDDLPSRIYISTILKGFVDDVYVAENGAMGIDLFNKYHPDVIVSDIGMPQMNGLEMSRKIKAINTNQQIILTTAFDNKNYLIEAIDIGINQYITKPVQRNSIYEAIKRAAHTVLLEKQVNKQLERIQLLSLAVDQSPSMVIILSVDGIVEYVNQKYEALSGLFTDDVIGKDTYIFNIADDDRKKIRELWNQVRDDAIADKDYEHKAIQFIGYSKDNVPIWFSASITPVKNDKCELTHFLFLLQDISEIKHVEFELQNVNNQLEQRVKDRTAELELSNQKLLAEIEYRKRTEDEIVQAKEIAETASKTKSAFLAKVSHELRTPMNGILGMTSILLNDVLSEKQEKFLNMVKISADNLLEIINDILDFSKLEAGKLSFSPHNFKFQDILDYILMLHTNNCKVKGIDLVLNSDTNIPEVLYGDSGRIRQILINLVSNAVKFTEKGRVQIDIKMREQSSDNIVIDFKVSDTGIGIPENKIDQLFQSFSQLDDSLSRKYGGTGLGLAISKELVEMMNGKIWAESKFGEGSTFNFYIQVRPGEEESDDFIRDINNAAKQNNRTYTIIPIFLKILVADDSFINQELIKTIFDSYIWEVDTFDNGKDALEAFRFNKYDIMFLDVQMPELNGIELTKMIREFEEENSLVRTPIVGLTGLTLDEEVSGILKSGMDLYIAKPFQNYEIIEAVRKLLPGLALDPSYDIIDTSDLQIDMDGLTSSLNFNKIVINRIIQYFINNYTRELEECKRALIKRDFKAISEYAHKFKSELGNFKALKAMDYAKQLEHISKTNSDYVTVKNLINPFIVEVVKIARYLSEYKINF